MSAADPATLRRFLSRPVARRATRAMSIAPTAAWPLASGPLDRFPIGDRTHLRLQQPCRRSRSGLRLERRFILGNDPCVANQRPHRRKRTGELLEDGARRRRPNPCPAGERHGRSRTQDVEIPAREFDPRVLWIYLGRRRFQTTGWREPSQRSRTLPVGAAYRRLFGCVPIA